MTFFQSIRTVFLKYAEFEGRASRPEFWWFILFTTIVSAVLSSLTYRTLDPRMFEVTTTANSLTGFISFAGAWNIAVLVPSLAVAVRRLRDAGHEWTQLLWLLLPIAGAIVLIVRLADPSVAATVVVQEPVAPVT